MLIFSSSLSLYMLFVGLSEKNIISAESDGTRNSADKIDLLNPLLDKDIASICFTFYGNDSFGSTNSI